LAINPATGDIWAAGEYKDNKDKMHSLLVVFDANLEVERMIDYPEGDRNIIDRHAGFAGICFDEVGIVQLEHMPSFLAMLNLLLWYIRRLLALGMIVEKVVYVFVELYLQIRIQLPFYFVGLF